ncbi:MAG TPA: 1,4-beta-xylanase [Phycisphaerae bacterium]|nr:1,4-beta-xylanase [Phycisphaerae bacterium]HRY71293.1 1,4-beta-xylanase [Phycisphaerae bacterium]HSA29759.1 1,4-beta-xylanase [Phycisphaerae bacterium]
MESRKVLGFNYSVRTAVNDIEQWQATTFDLKTIDQESGWAEKIRYTSVRVFLSYTVWLDDPPGFRRRLGQLLDTARRHGLNVMPVLLADGEYTGHVGPQPDPVPGVHNSRAVVAPGVDVALDPQRWPPLKAFVRDVVSGFGDDDRIIAWDVYNEPGNSPAGEKVLPLVDAVFVWARGSRPIQPLTTGPWRAYDSPFSQRLIALSDVVTFHNYESPEKMKEAIHICSRGGRPILCTEWLRRQVGNTFSSILPVFSEQQVGWYQWGLVAGRTQTYYHWGSKPGTPPPTIWQHDLLRPDGTPYDGGEVELLRKLSR